MNDAVLVYCYRRVPKGVRSLLRLTLFSGLAIVVIAALAFTTVMFVQTYERSLQHGHANSTTRRSVDARRSAAH